MSKILLFILWEKIEKIGWEEGKDDWNGEGNLTIQLLKLCMAEEFIYI